MRTIAKPQRAKGWIAGWLLVSWIAAIGFAATSARADIYSWEDSKGVIHYSNQEVPPEAALYMRETAPPVNTEPTEIKDENNNGGVARETPRQQAQAQLEEVNHKLNRALEKVDDLTASVDRSRAQAEAAAEAARQAEREAAAASSDQSDTQEQVIVYTVPYRRYGHHNYRYINQGNNHRGHRVTNRHSRRLNLVQDATTHAYGAHSKSGQIKRHGHNAYNYQIPGPILPPEPYRIPAAYGVR